MFIVTEVTSVTTKIYKTRIRSGMSVLPITIPCKTEFCLLIFFNYGGGYNQTLK